MAAIGTLNNIQTDSLTSSGGHAISIDCPVVALAFGWCKVAFSSSAYLAGKKVRVSLGSYQVDVTLDTYGNGEVSLLPFIRAYVASGDVQSLPLETDPEEVKMDNSMRGVMGLIFTDLETSNNKAMNVYYIYGTNMLEAAADKYINLNTGDSLGTWQTLDLITLTDAYGKPLDADDWKECNYNLNLYIPTPDDVEVINVAQYQGDEIVNAAVNYHLIEDCRVSGVKAVKWLDRFGGINIRKLTFAGEKLAGAHSDAYQRPHTDLNVPNGDYYHGDDKWDTITPSSTITLGDDSIPMQLYEWLKELVTSPVVELWSGDVDGDGLWLRCNVGDASIDRDPRKSSFSLTLTLQVPSYVSQQF